MESLPKSKFAKYLKPYWNPTLKELNRERKIALKNYRQNGEPNDPNSPIFIALRDAKRKFRAERRRAEFIYMKKKTWIN